MDFNLLVADQLLIFPENSKLFKSEPFEVEPIMLKVTFV